MSDNKLIDAAKKAIDKVREQRNYHLEQAKELEQYLPAEEVDPTIECEIEDVLPGAPKKKRKKTYMNAAEQILATNKLTEILQNDGKGDRVYTNGEIFKINFQHDVGFKTMSSVYHFTRNTCPMIVKLGGGKFKFPVSKAIATTPKPAKPAKSKKGRDNTNVTARLELVKGVKGNTLPEQISNIIRAKLKKKDFGYDDAIAACHKKGLMVNRKHVENAIYKPSLKYFYKKLGGGKFRAKK